MSSNFRLDLSNTGTFPNVTPLSNGGFVVAWMTTSTQYYGQIFGPYGNRVGSEIAMVSGGNACYYANASPGIAGLTDGSFVVAGTGYSFNSYAARFNSAGYEVVSDFTYPSSGTSSYYWKMNPSVAALPNAGFVIAWTNMNSDQYNTEVYVRKFNSGGGALTGDLQANTYSSSIQALPSIATYSDGSFVVTWMSTGNGVGYDIYFQRYDASANKVGSETMANTYTTGDQRFYSSTTPYTACNYATAKHIAILPSGGFVITWNGGANESIRAQIFDSTGNKVGTEITVNTTTAVNVSPGITVLPSGDFVIVWFVTSPATIRGQRFDSSGNKVGLQFTVVSSTDAAAPVEGPTIATLPAGNLFEGGFIVTWPSGSGSYAQIYDSNSNEVSFPQGTTGNDNITGTSVSEIIQGLAGNDIIEAKGGADAIDGGAGTDTASYSTSTAGVTVNLLTGTATGGDATGDTLTAIENLAGSAFADTLIGDTNANVLEGKAGSDALDGGAGSDTATYVSSTAGVTVSLTSGTGVGGDADGDTLTNIENLVGSALNDVLTGDANANNIQGGDGDDILEGKAGSDTLNGGTGTDTASYSTSTTAVSVNLATGAVSGGDAAGDTFTSIENLIGSAYADTLAGDSNANVIEGKAGADNINGGAGTDTATYVSSTAGVTVDLSTGTGTGGDAQGDTLTNIENLTGSALADTLTGNSNVNTLLGGDGDDVLEGKAGADVLDGGAGSDTASYSTASAAVTVSLTTGTGTVGDANGDTLTNIENLTGSPYGDTLTGDANANTLQGGAGDDVIEGKAGSDTINGGSGSDTASYASSTAAVTINLTAGTATGGDAAGDTLTNIENLLGSTLNDNLTGDANANNLQGGNGDDVLEGKAGSDILNGGNGSDTASYSTSTVGVTVNLATGTGTGGDAAGDTFTSIENLTGSALADTLTGDSNANILEGKAGADILDGGAGSDTASYASSSAAVTVNLAAGTATGGDAAGDTLTNIENLTGSAFADTLTGDANANTLQGGDGDDILNGKAGADTLNGGAGIDTVTYISSTTGVTVDLAAGTGTGGDAQGDTLTNVENLTGSAFADNLTGDLNANILDGGAGSDVLDGGAGIDTATYASSTAGVTVNLETGMGYGGDAEGDTLANIENLTGSAFADTLIGDSNANNLQGGDGNDILEANGGLDVLTGGAGNDIFKVSQLSSGSNSATITDFEIGKDKINLVNLPAITEFSQLSLSSSNGGVDTTIQIDTQNSIVISGVNGNSLSSSDFIFSRDTSGDSNWAKPHIIAFIAIGSFIGTVLFVFLLYKYIKSRQLIKKAGRVVKLSDRKILSVEARTSTQSPLGTPDTPLHDAIHRSFPARQSRVYPHM